MSDAQVDKHDHTELPEKDYRRYKWPDLELTEFQWRILDSIEAEGGVTGRKGILKYCETCSSLTPERNKPRRDGTTVHRHINSLVDGKVLKKEMHRMLGYRPAERFRVNWPESKPSPTEIYRPFVPS